MGFETDSSIIPSNSKDMIAHTAACTQATGSISKHGTFQSHSSRNKQTCLDSIRLLMKWEVRALHSKRNRRVFGKVTWHEFFFAQSVKE